MAYWNINDKKMVWDRLFLSSWLVADKEVGFGNPSFSSDMNLLLLLRLRRAQVVSYREDLIPEHPTEHIHTHKRKKKKS